MTIIPNYENFQPRFQLYMMAYNLKTGDHYQSWEYIAWIMEKARDFRVFNNMPKDARIPPDMQDEFTGFIRTTVENDNQKVTEEQLSLF